jgi:hypothetical protein
MSDEQTRRRVLRTGIGLGSLTLVSVLAGCGSPGGDEDSEDGEEENGGEDSEDGEEE